ncbi:hypothetical protein C1645_736597 [Glomus cerebriforme]|uniref:Uncharacterized protein n=1 Tax=Glomus cerebriforme TaxID=658196 RepID=A0A397TB50_9GLOM|nr:hypothetical protein C1645_736597 [Glomus cerebriforme]
MPRKQKQQKLPKLLKLLDDITDEKLDKYLDSLPLPKNLTEEEVDNFLNSLPCVRRPSSKGTLLVITTNNSSATPSGVMHICRQASSEEAKKMKVAGGLVSGIGNSNKVKWVSKSARYASQHHNTSSAQNQNVYRIEVNHQKYEKFCRECVEKTSLHSKNVKYGCKKGETGS